jgi:hypothetical protein
MAYIYYTASRDTYITEQYPSGNFGQSSILKVGRVLDGDTGQRKNYRSLLYFDFTDFNSKINSGYITGAVTCSLRLFDCYSDEGNQPYNFDIYAHPISNYLFTEGRGISDDGYTSGASSWIQANSSNNWVISGGDFDSSTFFSCSFENGTEDFVTNLKWWPTASNNYGLLLKLPDELESGSLSSQSYDTKRFFSKQSSTIFKPRIEIKWPDYIQDDKNKFYYSYTGYSKFCYYNFVNSVLTNLQNINNTNMLKLDIYPSGFATPFITTYASNSSTGIYQASNIFVTSSYSSSINYWKLVWTSGSTAIKTEYITGSSETQNSQLGDDQIIIKCINLKTYYNKTETARFDFFTRYRYPTYAFASGNESLRSLIIPNMYYQIIDVVDSSENYKFMPFDNECTKMSYDFDGNYFNLDMSSFHIGRVYGIQVKYLIGNQELIYPQLFKFIIK